MPSVLHLHLHCRVVCVLSVFHMWNACNVFNVKYAKDIHHVMFTTYAIYGIRVVIAIFVMSAAYGLYVMCDKCVMHVNDNDNTHFRWIQPKLAI